MQISIERKQAFQVIGKRWTVSSKDGENYRVIPGYWEAAMEDGTFDTLYEQALENGLFQGTVLGVCFNGNPERQEFEYMIAVEKGTETLPPDWESHQFESHTYAIFKNQGNPLPQAIQSTFKYIYENWFPANPHKPADGPELEVYHAGDAFEIWIPVKSDSISS